MNTEVYTKEMTALLKSSDEYVANKAPKGKVTQSGVSQRIKEINLLLNPSSQLLLDVSVGVKPVSTIVKLMAERNALYQVRSNYDFNQIALAGNNSTIERIDALQDEYRGYFKRHIRDANASELIPKIPNEFKTELEGSLFQYQSNASKANELKASTQLFMADLNKILKQKTIKKSERNLIKKRAQEIGPECINALAQLNHIPLSAE